MYRSLTFSVRPWILLFSLIILLQYHYTLYHLTCVRPSLMVYSTLQTPPFGAKLLTIKWKVLSQCQALEYITYREKLDSVCPTGGCTYKVRHS